MTVVSSPRLPDDEVARAVPARAKPVSGRPLMDTGRITCEGMPGPPAEVSGLAREVPVQIKVFIFLITQQLHNKMTCIPLSKTDNVISVNICIPLFSSHFLKIH